MRREREEKEIAAVDAAAAAAAKAAEVDAATEGVPLEWGRILTQEDFNNIHRLKRRRLVEAAM